MRLIMTVIPFTLEVHYVFVHLSLEGALEGLGSEIIEIWK